MFIMAATDVLQNRLVELLEKELHLIVPSVQTDLFESGGMDSLVFLDLLLLLEREFRITIDMLEIEIVDFQSVESISAYLSKQMQYGQDVSQNYQQLQVTL